MCYPDFSDYIFSGNTTFHKVACQNWTKSDNSQLQYLTYQDSNQNWIPVLLYSPSFQIEFKQVEIRKQTDSIFTPPKKCPNDYLGSNHNSFLESATSTTFSIPDCLLFS